MSVSRANSRVAHSVCELRKPRCNAHAHSNIEQCYTVNKSTEDKSGSFGTRSLNNVLRKQCVNNVFSRSLSEVFFVYIAQITERFSNSPLFKSLWINASAMH